MHRRLTQYLTLFWAFLAISLNAAEEISVNARFEPSVIAEGGHTFFVVETINTGKPLDKSTLRLPKGIELAGNPRQQRETKIINGDYRYTASLAYPVNYSSVGEYTVPEWQAEIDGKVYTVAATTLKVMPAGEEMKDALMLKLEGLDGSFYVGEVRRGQLNLYIRNDTEINQIEAFQTTGEGFLVETSTEEPRISRIRLNNQFYRVATWDVTLTAISTGPQEISWSSNMMIAIASQKPRPMLSNDPFDRMMSSFMMENQPDYRKVKLGTESYTFDVKALPEAGKPEGFSGAIGKFTVEDKVKKTKVAAGEPIEVSLTVSGTGNFERISAPKIDLGEGWKAYPPKATFEADKSDPMELKGKKVFEYIFIPIDESIHTLPSIPFSYFDPITEKYYTLNHDATEIEVTPAVASKSVITETQPAESAQSKRPQVRERKELFPIQLLSDGWTNGIGPIFYNRTFLLLQGVPAIALLGIALVRKRQLKLREDAGYARMVSASRNLKSSSKELAQAQGKGDTQAFFAAARRMVQEASTKHFKRGVKAESLTCEEICSVLENSGTEAPMTAEIRAIFEQCDALHFAGNLQGTEDLPQWRKRIETLIHQI